MAGIAYSVTATLPDEAIARDYLAWLADGHVDAVVAGGATSGLIIRLDPPADQPGLIRVETRYLFPSREAFDWYVEQVAPPLRAEGQRRFGSDRGVSFERRLGEIL